MWGASINLLDYFILLSNDGVHTDIEYDGNTLEVIQHDEIDSCHGFIGWFIPIVVICKHLHTEGQTLYLASYMCMWQQVVRTHI